MKTKIQFYIGKGGVGKSTVSSLYSVLYSKSKKVILVSLDSAHNLSDIFEDSFSDKPKAISQNLTVIEINIYKKINEYLKEIENDLARSNTNLSAFNLLNEFKIIRQAPGLEEYGLLKAFADIIEHYKNADFIIFDMPPTALTMKFFNLPSRSLLWIEKLIDLRNRIKEKKEIVSTIKIGKTTLEKDKILEKLLTQRKEYLSQRELLKNKNVEINLVVNQDSLSINEGKKIINELNDLEISICKIITNKTVNNSLKIFEFDKYECVSLPNAEEKLIGLQNIKKFIESAKALSC